MRGGATHPLVHSVSVSHPDAQPLLTRAPDDPKTGHTTTWRTSRLEELVAGVQVRLNHALVDQQGAHRLAHQHVHLCSGGVAYVRLKAGDSRLCETGASAASIGTRLVHEDWGPSCQCGLMEAEMYGCRCVAAWIERRIKGSFTAPTCVTAVCSA